MQWCRQTDTNTAHYGDYMTESAQRADSVREKKNKAWHRNFSHLSTVAICHMMNCLVSSQLPTVSEDIFTQGVQEGDGCEQILFLANIEGVDVSVFVNNRIFFVTLVHTVSVSHTPN